MFKTVLNFSILEQDEVVLVPTARVLDYFRLTFGSRLSSSAMANSIRFVSVNPLQDPCQVCV